MTTCNARFLRRPILLLLLAALCLPAGTLLAATRPVVLELFTSNSCSSCPPATELLSRLRARPPADDVQIILLSQHVDYWNDLGWVDRYSDAQFTARQRAYAREVFGSSRVYTPQLVVNGRREMVGSRASEVKAAIGAESGQASLPVSLTLQRSGTDAVNVTVSVDKRALPEPATVWLALTQDNVVSHIGAGENSGRRLEEDGVVRLLKPLGTYPNTAQTSHNYRSTLQWPADGDNLAVVAFVQQAQSRAIIGAAKNGLVTEQ